MASTDWGVNNPLTNKLFSDRLLRQALKKCYLNNFIGSDATSLIQRFDETSKGPGDKITYGLQMQLTGLGISGDNTLIGNEEALQYYSDALFIDQIRHAVRSGGRMSEQRVPYKFRKEAMDRLSDWMAKLIDVVGFNQLTGNTYATDLRLTGSNATIAYDSNHVVYPDGRVSEADVNSASASCAFSLRLIDICQEKATKLDIPIRPFMVEGSPKYIMFLDPYQVTDLRTSTATGQWLDIQQSAMAGGQISNNPIYTGALGEYNNTILHKTDYLPTNPVLPNVKRAVFCGAQAAGIAFGQMSSSGKPNWNEELVDYGNQLGVAGGMQWGLKKTRFNNADFSTIVVPTYAVAHG